MVSEFALGEISVLEGAGLHPSARDIVRLNALGLKVERARDAWEIYAAPRCSFMGPFAFREPTIGHEAWLETVGQYVDMADAGTFLTVHAFATSRNPADLPPALDRERVRSEIEAFSTGAITAYTIEQIRCAVFYAIAGNDAADGEAPAVKPDEAPRDEVMESIAAGVVNDGVAVGLGISLEDAYRMTVRQMQAVVIRALGYRGVDASKSCYSNATTAFWRTLEEIRVRLEKERDNGGQQD